MCLIVGADKMSAEFPFRRWLIYANGAAVKLLLSTCGGGRGREFSGRFPPLTVSAIDVDVCLHWECREVVLPMNGVLLPDE